MSLVFLKLMVCMKDKWDFGEKNYFVVFLLGFFWIYVMNYVGEKYVIY